MRKLKYAFIFDQCLKQPNSSLEYWKKAVDLLEQKADKSTADNTQLSQYRAYLEQAKEALRRMERGSGMDETLWGQISQSPQVMAKMLLPELDRQRHYKSSVRFFDSYCSF
jgi:small-conductance mechanosensitive channel